MVIYVYIHRSKRLDKPVCWLRETIDNHKGEHVGLNIFQFHLIYIYKIRPVKNRNNRSCAGLPKIDKRRKSRLG